MNSYAVAIMEQRKLQTMEATSNQKMVGTTSPPEICDTVPLKNLHWAQ
jgi:hypothetical protein